jgi:hypothetical protein
MNNLNFSSQFDRSFSVPKPRKFPQKRIYSVVKSDSRIKSSGLPLTAQLVEEPEDED